MGYLLKTQEGEYKMFYSEPSNGYYASAIMAFSTKEYDDFFKENPNEHNDFVWLEGWADTSETVHEKGFFGWRVDEHIADCIMQGETIEVNEPIEYNTISEA